MRQADAAAPDPDRPKPDDIVSLQSLPPVQPTAVRLRSRSVWQIRDPNAAWTRAEEDAYWKHLRLVHARKKSNRLTGLAMGGALLVGVLSNGAGSSGWTVESDGGLSEGTRSGGADKFDHAWSSHALTAVLSAFNRRYGVRGKEASLRGAIGAWLTMLTIEIGDGFSDRYGFSWTDVVANTVGALFGYAHDTSARMRDILDFRVQYWPSGSGYTDADGKPRTDYDGYSWVLATNLGALYSRTSNPLDFVDFQLGYRTKNYRMGQPNKQRLVLVGVGLNLTTVCERLGMPRLGRFFEYYQPPGISLQWSYDLND